MDTVTMGSPEPGARWPEHLPVGALRVVRWSARYDQTVTFYRDIIGLPVLEIFHDSYGLDGTILGLPGGAVHLEIVRLGDAQLPAPGLDQLVFYLPDAGAWERITARLAAACIHPVVQIDYWQANGGVTYRDPDGLTPCVRGCLARHSQCRPRAACAATLIGPSRSGPRRIRRAVS
jgi:catechol 2,3-dioxygenase-like lactoylglutathione lyase family enzyme